MGLFDSIKKSKEIKKNSDWTQGLNHTILELNEDHMKLTTIAETDIIFYKDIIEVQRIRKLVNVRTIRKTYPLTSKRGKERAEELQLQLLKKISEYK